MRRTLTWLLPTLFAVLTCGSIEARPEWFQWEELPSLPVAGGLAGHCAGVSHGVLLTAGGSRAGEAGTEKTWSDAVYAMRGAGEGEWEWSMAGRLPRGVSDGMSVTWNDRVLCIGGLSSEGTVADVFSMEWNTSQAELVIETLPPLPSPRAFGQAALLDGRIYVVGGQSGMAADTAVRNVWVLDSSSYGTEDLEWEAVVAWPGRERSRPLLAVQNNGTDSCLYVFGGRTPVRDGLALLVDGFEFTPRKYDAGRFDAVSGGYARDSRVGSPWRVLPDLPSPVSGGAAVAVGQAHIVVFGATDGSPQADWTSIEADPGSVSGTAGHALAYHTITETWVEIGELPFGNVEPVSVPWEDGAVLFSDLTGSRGGVTEVWKVSPALQRPHFGLVNYLTLVIYLAAMVGVGVYFAKRNRDTNDFFRGGQRIPWWAAGFSIFATMLSSITFVALPAVAFKTDWTAWGLQWTIPFIAVFVVWKILPFFRRIDATSAYEYLEIRFGYMARAMGSLLFTLFQVGRMAVVMYLPALALRAVTGLEPIPCILIMGLLSVVYCTMGGIEAVVWTDTIQTVVLLGGALLSVILIFTGIEGGAGAFFATALEQGKFRMVEWDFSATSYMTTAIWVILFGSIFQNLASYTSDQAVIQRYMTTDTQKNAARAILTNGLMAVPASMLFFGVGTALFVYYKHHPAALDPAFKADAIFPLFIATRMPPVASGLVVAAVFAAAQSTLSTSMNSLSTTLVTDFARPVKLCDSERGYLVLARWLTALLGTFGTSMAVLFVLADVFDIFSTYVSILGMFMGVLCGMFMLGMFTRRGNLAGCLSGAVLTSFFMLWLNFWSGWGVHGFLYPAISVTLCFLLGYLLSLLLPGSSGPKVGRGDL